MNKTEIMYTKLKKIFSSSFYLIESIMCQKSKSICKLSFSPYSILSIQISERVLGIIYIHSSILKRKYITLKYGDGVAVVNVKYLLDPDFTRYTLYQNGIQILKMCFHFRNTSYLCIFDCWFGLNLESDRKIPVSKHKKGFDCGFFSAFNTWKFFDRFRGDKKSIWAKLITAQLCAPHQELLYNPVKLVC